MKLEDAGAIMRLMRRASHLALNDAKKNGLCKNPMDAAIMIYTDCPCTASWAATNDDLVHFCGVSQIEGVACVMGGNFPEYAFEAERDDKELPRVAAMFFHATGTKCLRCRMVCRSVNEDGLCNRCAIVVKDLT